MPEIGVITEQGDMGLGFNPLSPEDQKKVEKEVLGKDKNNDEKE